MVLSSVCVHCVVQHKHLIFLSAELILQFKLLSLQLVHPLPQLFSFLSVTHRYSEAEQCFFFHVGGFFALPQVCICLNIYPQQKILYGIWCNKTILLHLLESFLAQVLDVQTFASVT